MIDADGADGFPLEQLRVTDGTARQGADLLPEEIEDLLDSKYGSKRTFAILALLFPHVDTRNIHHVDHVYPHSLLGARKLKAGVRKADINQIGDPSRPASEPRAPGRPREHREVGHTAAGVGEGNVLERRVQGLPDAQ